ncbi:hypothetical protein F4859DRAFT_444171 [Xylaria cf. heliscus]|nr:hypothetical protein F4859DRAFT_444171 [Xylaria cf. heliscus]
MSFYFVDNSNINNKARKTIRSHVMKGKNCGKTRSRKEKQTKPITGNSIITYKPETARSSNEALITTLGHLGDRNSMLAVTRQVATDLSLLSPTRIAPQAMFHLRQLYNFILDVVSPPEFCRFTGVTEWMWFQLTFYNEAYFHCTIAMASACAAFLTGDSCHSPLALYHMSQAYRLINQQLSSKEALSDATIAVVAAINIYDRLYGDPQKAMVHLNGVAQMVELRGGIGVLAKRNPVIAEKVFRCDIELALHCGSNTKFSSDDVPRHFVLVHSRDCLVPRKLEEAELFESVLSQSVCVTLREVVFDFLRFSHILNQATYGDNNKLDPATYQSTLMYVGYRLLETQCPRHDSEVDTNFDTLVRLAMAGFYNTFCFGLDRKLMTFPPLIKQFTSVAQTICESDRSRQMVVFWALLMGNISSLITGDDAWLVANLKTLANDLELRTWSEVSNALRTFPWVKATHEAPGQKLWNKVLT